jgi:hypothetical protein
MVSVFPPADNRPGVESPRVDTARASGRRRRLGLGLCLAAVLLTIPIRAAKSEFLHQLPAASSPLALHDQPGTRFDGDPDGGRVFLERVKRAVEAADRIHVDLTSDAPVCAPAPRSGAAVQLEKPDYLKIYLLATPKNPRSPPA